MEALGALLLQALDLIIHVDAHLVAFVQRHGAWVYVLLFGIVFAETGFVLFPFLPGDALLFIAGGLAGAGLLNLPLLMAVLIAAAVLGNQTNYTIGRHFGPKVFQWEHSRFFNKHAFDQAHAFYERYGGITLVAARFLPLARSFAPFVAGVAEMTRRKFTFYDVTGGTFWVVSLTGAGYLLGNIPWVKGNLDTMVWILLGLTALGVAWGAWRARRKGQGPR